MPNSIVVSRGCPHHCAFCYKDAFFAGGRSFYTQRVDAALAEIARLPGRHLYFLDDHLLADARFARDLFRGMRGMGRVFQAAATVDSILRGDLVEDAAAAGLRSLFVGFETLSPDALAGAGKRQNLGRSYRDVVRRLDDLGIMINGSFVFGLDRDDGDVFARTVDWAVRSGITTATFHVLTPYPGTATFANMAAQGRITDPRLEPVRHAPRRLSAGPAVGGGAGARVLVGLPDVLPLGSHRAGGRGARLAEARAEAPRLQRGMEEVRAGVELRDPRQAARPDAAAARGRALAGRRRPSRRAQHLGQIDSRRAPRGHVGGQDGDDGQQRRDAGEGLRVGRLDAVEQ